MTETKHRIINRFAINAGMTSVLAKQILEDDELLQFFEDRGCSSANIENLVDSFMEVGAAFFREERQRSMEESRQGQMHT